MLFQKFDLTDTTAFVIVGLSFAFQFFWLRIVLTWYNFNAINCFVPGVKCYPFSQGISEWESVCKIILNVI